MNNTNIIVKSENEVVIKEGTVNAEMYSIVSGSAAMFYDYGTENEYLVGVLGEGRCFGEIGLLIGKPSPFSIVAQSDLMLIGIGADDLDDFIASEPRRTADIMRNLARMTMTMSANVNLIKEELTKALGDKLDSETENMLNKSLMRYRVVGLEGSPYFSRLA